MEDRLEKYIREHRDEFDSLEPDQGTWEKIAGEEPSTASPGSKKVIRLNQWIWRAAIIVVIFTAGFMAQRLLFPPGQSTENGQMAGQEIEIPELTEAKAYYSKLIDQKLKAIEPLLAGDPEIKEDITRDMAELDSLYNDMKKDLHDNIATAEVVDAMIQNYRLKLEILEEILDELSEKEKSGKDEKNNINL